MRLTSLSTLFEEGSLVFGLEFWRLNDPVPYYMVALIQNGAWTNRGFVSLNVPVRTRKNISDNFEIDWDLVAEWVSYNMLIWDETNFSTGMEIVICVNEVEWVTDILMIKDTDQGWFVAASGDLIGRDCLFLPTGRIYDPSQVELTAEYEHTMHQYYNK